ncbi:uncharacterized protein LOC113326532 [Papaver somniferum]|uniref:uncharacterized protein LOC113326532 n=1 Tax=Papaver somniferum TaxID=3469 RepID=UPI000E701458|nr:uncharacterized protein LOC113326532 [Papaver somniferum]
MDASSQACGTATPAPTSAATPTPATDTVVGSSIQPTYGSVEPETTTIYVEATSTQMGGNTDKITSDIWNHFTKNNVQEAECNYCKKIIKAHSGRNGTSGIWKHFNRCKKNPNKPKPKGQQTLTLKPETLGEDEGQLVSTIFSQEKCKRAVVEFIIIDEMFFRVVEGEGFRRMMHFLEPIVVPSNDCLQKFIKNLEKRIIMFCEVSGHKGIGIGETLEKCLSDWGIKDVFSVTLDNASANKVAMNYLTTSIVLMTREEERAKYLHVRFATHVLALVVKDVVRVYNKSIERIRSVVKYIKGSPARLAKLRQSSTKVTTNIFLWKLVIIYEKLVAFRDNVDEDPFIATMDAKMFKKYNKYWVDYAKMNFITFFAMFLDPREKEKGLEFAPECLYGKKSSKVESVMRSVLLDFNILFEEYKDVYSVHEEQSSTSMQGQAKSVLSKPGTGPSRMKEFMSRSKIFKSNPDDDVGKNELDRYFIDKFEEGEGEDVEAFICTQSWLRKPIQLDLLSDYIPDDNVLVEEEILGRINNNATTSTTMEYISTTTSPPMLQLQLQLTCH